jgi:glycine oxidase
LPAIILGAGVIGAAIAEALASRGADVTVLDMRSPGRGASQASAGILAPFTEAVRDGPLLDLGRRSLDLYDAFVAGVRERSGRPIEYARTGTLEVALNESERGHLQDVKAWLDGSGVAAAWLEPAELRRFEPTVAGSATGGLFIERHGFVGVTSLVAALVQSAKLSGAVFEDAVEAASIESGPGGVTVRTADGRQYSAGAVVVATGSWTGRLRIRGAKPPAVRPVRGQLLHLRVPAGRRPARVVWGSGCYAVPWSDGSVLVGATVEDAGFDESSTAGGVAGLLQAGADLLPSLAGASVEAIRVGLRPQAAGGLPVVGALPDAPGVIMATGHYRNGVLLAPLTASQAADSVLATLR